jgi:hypothetical protein
MQMILTAKSAFFSFFLRFFPIKAKAKFFLLVDPAQSKSVNSFTRKSG